MSPQSHALLIGVNDYPYIANKDLGGCANDVAVMRSLLIDRFEFPDGNVRTLLNEDATRDNILAALEGLLERAEDDGVVVLGYSGHGSRIKDPYGVEEFRESLVPHDSGRDKYPNRDVMDFEIDQWVQRLNQKTPNVTLLFDCCHSGSVTRDAFGAATREVAPDLRDPATMFGPDGPPPPPVATTRSLDDLPTLSGWRPGARTAVMLAGCRAQELANEHYVEINDVLVTHGALTYFLSHRLLHASGAISWRELFEEISPQVTNHYPGQHPQLEGRIDQAVFGTTDLKPAPYLTLEQVANGALQLTGGAAHGVTAGSLWCVYAPGTRSPEGEEALARVRVTAVKSTTAVVEVEGEALSLQVGMRAFVEEQTLNAPSLKVQIDSDSLQGGDRESLAARIDKSKTLLVAETDQPADVLLRLLPARETVSEADPCSWLGALPQPTWVAIGADGRTAVHGQPDSPAGLTRLITSLEQAARFRGLLALSNAAGSAINGAVSLEIKRWAPASSSFIAASTEGSDGLPSLNEGEGVDVVITNNAKVPVWVSVLQFGTDGSIDLLLPWPEHPQYSAEGVEIPAAESLSIAQYYDQHPEYDFSEGLTMSLPEGFPWTGEATDAGELSLKLIATLAPANFEFLRGGSFRSSSTRTASEGAESVLSLFANKAATRSLIQSSARRKKNVEWTTITRTMIVSRGQSGTALDAAGGALSLGGGVTLKAPGLAGQVVFQRGASGRTRDLGNEAPLHSVFGSELQTLATIEIRNTKPVTTRAVDVPVTADGEPAMLLTLPQPSDARAQVVLYTDEAGFMRWIIPEAPGASGESVFLVPSSVVEPPAQSGQRSLVTAVGMKLLRVMGFDRVEAAAGQAAARFFAQKEEARQPHCVRNFTVADYQRPNVAGALNLDADGWQKLGAGRALLMLHGTHSSSAQAFAGLDAETVRQLSDLYEGRVFAFDHPTVSVTPSVNVDWFLANLPNGINLDLDIISHSRGGLVARALARASDDRLRVTRLIMAGTPNRGTVLASREHIRKYIDMLSNAMNLLPFPGPEDVLLSVLDVVKAVVLNMADALEGLRSMDPDGEFLQRLNSAEGGSNAEHFALAAAFDGQRTSSDGLSNTVKQHALTALAETVFSEPSDLVVPTAGVDDGNGDPAFPIPSERVLRFGLEGAAGSDSIWHGAYFGEPAARAQILNWLRR